MISIQFVKLNVLIIKWYLSDRCECWRIEEKCGRMRVYVNDRKDRLLRKIVEMSNWFGEVGFQWELDMFPFIIFTLAIELFLIIDANNCSNTLLMYFTIFYFWWYNANSKKPFITLPQLFLHWIKIIGLQKTLPSLIDYCYCVI